MGTLTASAISTTYKNLIFTKGSFNQMYYTNVSDADIEITTLASKIIFTSGVQLTNGTIYDTNGNEEVVFTATGTAVNHLGVTNAATGNAVTIATLGGDNDVGLTLAPKGSGVVTCTPKFVATAGIELDNNIIYNSASETTITTDTDQGVTFAAAAAVTGDLTVSGDDIIIGGSDDATDKTILFKHDAAKAIIGIDDTHDRFIINADNSGAFDGTVLSNDFSIDISGNCYIKGDLTITGGNITNALTLDSTLAVSGVTTITGNLVFTGARDIVFTDSDGLEIKDTGGSTYLALISDTIAVSQPMTCSAKVLLSGNTGPVNGAGIDTDGSRHHSWIERIGGVVKTSIYVDVGGLASTTTDKDVIGLAAGGVAHIGNITTPLHGTIFAVKMTCLETPTTGADEIDLYNANEGTYIYDNPLVSTSTTENEIVVDSGAWTTGVIKGETHALTFGADEYLYLTSGEAGTAGTYGAGKFLIELWGVPS
jgi:hypothetical protein